MNINYYNQILTPQNVNNNFRQNKNLSFKSNPNSAKLLFKETDFFIRIDGYGKNFDWAKKVIAITDRAAQSMRRRKNFDKILAKIAAEMRKTISHQNFDGINHTGILRTSRKGYGKPAVWHESIILTPYYKPNSQNSSPYITYKSRFDKIKQCPLKTKLEGVSLTRMRKFFKDSIMEHGNRDSINSALDRIKNIYFMLMEKFITHPENVTKKTLPEINSSIAEIRWILAHSTPWERGSDSISNCFMRALYKAMGIKTYPAKKGKSFDLEAYCTELADYKKNFAKYFSSPPKVIEDDGKWSIPTIFKRFFNIN